MADSVLYTLVACVCPSSRRCSASAIVITSHRRQIPTSHELLAEDLVRLTCQCVHVQCGCCKPDSEWSVSVSRHQTLRSFAASRIPRQRQSAPAAQMPDSTRDPTCRFVLARTPYSRIDPKINVAIPRTGVSECHSGLNPKQPRAVAVVALVLRADLVTALQPALVYRLSEIPALISFIIPYHIYNNHFSTPQISSAHISHT